MGLLSALATGGVADDYKGRYCEGKGDAEFLRIIDESFRFFHPNPDTQNISMLYDPEWDCLIEGASWRAWWIQNSYGPTYCSLPFLQEPWFTSLRHSQDLWFRHQGDGKKVGLHTGHVGPPGALCDCAMPSGAIYVQGDGNWKIHDWGFEFTAAGVVMQSEMLLISRDMEEIRRYLPHLERACDFIETRRDPRNNLFLVGPAANLLAPSYAGAREADGSFGRAYLAGISVTYAAALNRMIELYKLTGDREKQRLYEARRSLVLKGLPRLATDEGYLVKYMEPDGTRHGIYGQEKYGYFETSPNVDAICFRVVDDAQAEKIYGKIVSIAELRPHAFLITNYPGLDDMYVSWGSRDAPSIFVFGKWVNGGVWHTLEARAIMAYYRLGKHEDVRRSASALRRFSEIHQMDAPLTEFGSQVWFTDKLTNFCYDALGIPAAVIRGLFEYVYGADSLTLYPHVPPSIIEYEQKEPIRWGEKKITISIRNGGPRVKSVKVNRHALEVEPGASRVVLRYDRLPARAHVDIEMDGGWPEARPTEYAAGTPTAGKRVNTAPEMPSQARAKYAALICMQKSCRNLTEYESGFLRETIAAYEAYRDRAARDAAGDFASLSEDKRNAIIKDYEDAANRCYQGFDVLMGRYASSGDQREKKIAMAWAEARKTSE